MWRFVGAFMLFMRELVQPPVIIFTYLFWLNTGYCLKFHLIYFFYNIQYLKNNIVFIYQNPH